MNLFIKTLSFSRTVLTVLISSVLVSFIAVKAANAQSELSCFMINNSGRTINLEHICNVKPQCQSTLKPITEVNNDSDKAAIVERINDRSSERIYVLGDGNNSLILNPSNTIYYSGDRPVYLRRYRQVRRFLTRNDARNTFLRPGSDVVRSQIDRKNARAFRDTLLIIYRYQK